MCIIMVTYSNVGTIWVWSSLLISDALSYRTVVCDKQMFSIWSLLGIGRGREFFCQLSHYLGSLLRYCRVLVLLSIIVRAVLAACWCRRWMCLDMLLLVVSPISVNDFESTYAGITWSIGTVIFLPCTWMVRFLSSRFTTQTGRRRVVVASLSVPLDGRTSDWLFSGLWKHMDVFLRGEFRRSDARHQNGDVILSRN